MAQFNDTIEANLALALAGLGLVCLVLLLLIVVQAVRIRRLGRRLDSVTRGADGRNLESVLDTHLQTVMRVARGLEDLTTRTIGIEANARAHFQRLGLVRFNPFEDTGGNQSFALALLNADDNGFVFSSLHSRTGTRVYAKAIKEGRAETALSTEEAEAVELARRGPSARAEAGAAGKPGGNGRPNRIVRMTPDSRSQPVPARQGGEGPSGSGQIGAGLLDRRPGDGAEDDASLPRWEDPSAS